VTFPATKPLRAGELYTVFTVDEDRPVRAPDSGEVLGYLVSISGDMMVDQIGDKGMARGALVDTLEPIERGFRVSPFVRQFRRVEPRGASVTLEARVIAAFTPARMLAAGNFVVLSRGKKDGLAVGNRAFVVRRGDGYRPVRESWEAYDARYPKEVVGELLVVDVRDATAVAWVARTTKEIRVGELTELRKGY
jgi:hypothetical protein